MAEKTPMDEVTRERWLSKLGKLRIDRKGGPAPHKPLLLLVIIELAEARTVAERNCPPSRQNLLFDFVHTGRSSRIAVLKSPMLDILFITCKAMAVGKLLQKMEALHPTIV